MAVQDLLENPPNLPWTVQKFGGTSIGKHAAKIATDIVGPRLCRGRIAVVCSACSFLCKGEGTTTQLLRICDAVEAGLRSGYSAAAIASKASTQLALIVEDHASASSAFIRAASIQAGLAATLRDEALRVVDDLRLALAGDVDKNAKEAISNRIVSFGERLSCLVMRAVLEDAGIRGEVVDLSNAVPFTKSHLHDECDEEEFYCKLISYVAPRVRDCGNRVPIITGFFGSTPSPLLSGSIGRGYTDFCASLCAVSLAADELQIWKEVNGVFTADPRQIPSAVPLPAMALQDLAALTSHGSEVVHPAAVQRVVSSRVPIAMRIMNVEEPEHPGTAITTDIHNTITSSIQAYHCAAITCESHACLLSLQGDKICANQSLLGGLLDGLGDNALAAQLDVDDTTLLLCLKNADRGYLGPLKKSLLGYGDLSIVHNLAIVTLVGVEGASQADVTFRLLGILGGESIHCCMVCQSPAQRCVSCVVHSSEATKAARSLHDQLCLACESA